MSYRARDGKPFPTVTQGLCDMAPYLARSYVSNRSLRDSVLFPKLDKRAAIVRLFANLSNLLLGKFGIPVTHTHDLISAFAKHIPNVIPPRSEKQMGWSNAGHVVATMKNPLAERNITTMQNPRDMVGVAHSADNGHLSVAPLGSATNPHPAAAKFGHEHGAVNAHFVPELFKQRFWSIIVLGHRASLSGLVMGRVGVMSTCAALPL